MAVCVDPIGIGPGPFTVDSQSEKQARARALKMVALAGARLANLLNESLKTVVLGARARTDEHTVGTATDRLVIFNQHFLKFHDPNVSGRTDARGTASPSRYPRPLSRAVLLARVCGGWT